MSVPPTPLIDSGTAFALLSGAAPHWTALLELLENSQGQFAFRSEFTDAIANLRIESYPLLYENEASVGVLLARAMLGKEGARDFDEAMRTATPEERGAALQEVGQDLEAFGDAIDFDTEDAERTQAKEAFQSLPADQQTKAVEFAQHVFAGILVLFYQQLSIMVHGEKLTALVAQSKAGNDEAFLKAIQIDKRILTKVPYFEARFMRAQLQDERQFRTAVARKLEASPYVGKISHKKLWLAFAFLEGVGLLESFDGNGLLDMLQEVGVIDDEKPIDDVKNLLKLKARYREFQARGGVSTP
jgi:membrane-associated protease RseP (regulator of RpoE activity)